MNQTFQKIVGGVLAVTALMGLSACGSKTEDTKADGKTYKVGIVQFVDDASLNQIEAAIEAELDAKATELGVKFDYTLYNGQAGLIDLDLNQQQKVLSAYGYASTQPDYSSFLVAGRPKTGQSLDEVRDLLLAQNCGTGTSMKT